jgi:hypothetical protein
VYVIDYQALVSCHFVLECFSSRNQEKKKTQEKQGTKEKKEKPSHVSPFTFSHEHNRRRVEETPQNKKRKTK